jgi:DEAD/DEAH box helicase domain-containing protein
MARLDAIKLADSLKRRLLDFTLSSNYLRDDRLLEACRLIWESAPEDGGLCSDLWVETSVPPLTSGRTLPDLQASGHLESRLVKQLLTREVFPPDRPLYWHQCESVVRNQPHRKPRPATIVSAGTGAGKTESFLLPLLNLLYSERRNKGTGCRAIILYPMNALVNDQVDRLYDWLQGQERLTLAHFTSETPEDAKKAHLVPDYHRCRHRTRQQARGLEDHRGHRIKPSNRAEPPDILITNYSMLEYMLCRPQDRIFFGSGLRAVVLDEAHLYTGTLAAEMTLLLRRLYDKCGLKTEHVMQFATSATIGTGTAKELQDFASTIFSKSPEHVEVIQGRVAPPSLPEEAAPEHPVHLKTLASQTLKTSTVKMDLEGRENLLCSPAQVEECRSYLEQLVAKNVVDQFAQESDGYPARFLNALGYSPHLQKLDSILRDTSQISIEDLSGKVWGETTDDARSATAGLLSVAASARAHLNAPPLLPHRLHLMLRPADGISVCCNQHCSGPEHLKIAPLGTLLSGRHERCPHCQSLCLELARCSCCGEPVLASGQSGGRLRPPLPFEPAERYYTVSVGPNQVSCHIDPSLGSLSAKGLEVVALDHCPNCGAETEDFQRIASPNALALSIIAETLFSEMPPLACDNENSNKFLPARGRRLLAFSDSRSEAARLGPRLRRQHERQMGRAALFRLFEESPGENPQTIAFLQRKVTQMEETLSSGAIPAEFLEAEQRELQRLKGQLESLQMGGSLNDWASSLAGNTALMSQLLEEDWAEQHKADSWEKQQAWDTNCRLNREKARALLQREIARLPRRPITSVETIGGVQVMYPGLTSLLPSDRYLGCLPAAMRKKLSEAWPELLATFLDTLRIDQRVTLGSYEEDELWQEGGAPMGRWISLHEFRGVKEEARRRRFALNVLKAAGFDGEPNSDDVDQLLEVVFEQLLEKGVPVTGGQREPVEAGQLACLERAQRQHHNRGPEDSIRISIPGLALKRPGQLYRCGITGHVWPRSVLGCAPDITRPGALEPISSEELDATPVVGRQRKEYRDLSEVFRLGLWAEEHSAQLAPVEARRLQELFRRGMRNLLSATTTLELGIDIGGLSGTLLSNVPPGKANYLQRAGRVGRRADGSSVVLTYARSRPYDREVFKRIGDFLSRPLRQPLVFLERDRIARRHFHAWLMGGFFAQLYQLKDHVGAMTAFGRMGSFCMKPTPMRWARGMTRLPHLNEPGEPLPPDFVKPGWWKDADDGLVTPFRLYLKESRQKLDVDYLRELFRDTPLAEHQDWTILFDQAAKHFDKVVRRWCEDYDTLLSVWGTATKRAQANSVRYQMLSMAETTVIETFSDQRFLPRYGFPIGVHKLRVTTMDEEKNTVREEDQYRLERASLLALREYVPGSQLMVGGKMLTSRGLLKHWSGANIDNAFGLRGGLSICPNRHQYYWHGEPQRECPFCGEQSQDDSFRELLFPQHGFTTAAWDPPKRSSDTDRVGEVNTATVAFSARARGQAAHSISESSFAEVPGLNLQYQEEGEILVFNGGKNGTGFAICTACGYSDSERENSSKLPAGFERHKPLHMGPASAPCAQQVDASILRNQFLGGRQPTDIVMLDFGEYIPRALDSEVAVTSLAVALHLAGARLLQLDSRELGHMVVPAGERGFGLGAAVFDNVPGGAGHVLELMRRGREWLESTVEFLRGTPEHDQNCSHACLDCLMTFDAQVHFNRNEHALDRRVALRVLDNMLQPATDTIGTVSEHSGASVVREAPLALSKADLLKGGLPETFLFKVKGRGMDKRIPPDSLCLFRRSSPQNELPPRDSLVLVGGPYIEDPDNGEVTVRRFRYTPISDPDGNVANMRVTLRHLSTDRKAYRNINFEVPIEDWERWRPLGVFEDIVEEEKWQV